MTENSSPTVGRAAIDAYLDSVEQALMSAHAPRSDRLQVLQDLESQIADMLTQQPMPLTEESVRAVLDKLEPPSHFAATYGNGTQTNPSAPSPSRFARLPRAPWPMIAAASCALLCVDMPASLCLQSHRTPRAPSIYSCPSQCSAFSSHLSHSGWPTGTSVPTPICTAATSC